MPEDLTLPRVLPITTFFFQVLFLLITIPIEAYILNRWLKFDKKTSIFYAISMNVFSSVIGWNVFFFLEPILPIGIKSELMSYIFFNNLKLANTHSLIILTAFVIFFGTFIVKFLILKFLIIALDTSGKKIEPVFNNRQRGIQFNRYKLQNTSLVTTTLIANSLSYTAITFILLIRSR
jgi:hypothetical protein